MSHDGLPTEDKANLLEDDKGRSSSHTLMDIFGVSLGAHRESHAPRLMGGPLMTWILGVWRVRFTPDWLDRRGGEAWA